MYNKVIEYNIIEGIVRGSEGGEEYPINNKSKES